MNTFSKNNNINLTRMTSHIGIHRNERVDKTAKEAHLTDLSNRKIPYTDLKPNINKFIHDKW